MCLRDQTLLRVSEKIHVFCHLRQLNDKLPVGQYECPNSVIWLFSGG